ncbi:MAG: hypothetical protein ACKVOR_06585 [Flavobacteriales bacterium]
MKTVISKTLPVVKMKLMKATMLVALLACGSAIALAASSFTAAKPEKYAEATFNEDDSIKQTSLSSWMKTHFTCPEYVGSKPTMVYLKLHADANGKLHIIEINSDNSRLADYVKYKLENANLTLPENERGKDLRYNIRFQQI